MAAAHTQRHAGAGCTVLLSRTPAPSGGVPAYPKRLRGPFGGGRPGMVSDSAVAGQQGGMEGWRGEGMGGKAVLAGWIDWLAGPAEPGSAVRRGDRQIVLRAHAGAGGRRRRWRRQRGDRGLGRRWARSRSKKKKTRGRGEIRREGTRPSDRKCEAQERGRLGEKGGEKEARVVQTRSLVLLLAAACRPYVLRAQQQFRALLRAKIVVA